MATEQAPTTDTPTNVPVTTLLVIDDDPISLRLASALLGKALPHYKVQTCNGIAPFEAVELCCPGLVVTDLYMPETDGLSIVDKLRRTHPELPVVVMTAHGSEESAVKALRMGAASYVPKQRLAEELVETVKWVLAVRAQQSRHEEAFDYMAHVHRRFILPNRSELIAPIVSEIQEDLGRLDVCPEEDLVRFGVALTETLMNAMIHGNLGLPGSLLDQGYSKFRGMVEQRLVTAPYRDRRVFFDLQASRDEVVCIIRDEGEGFNPSSLPDPTDPEMMLRPHGRGLLLIQTFMDEVRFNDRGNEITLVKRSGRRSHPVTA